MTQWHGFLAPSKFTKTNLEKWAAHAAHSARSPAVEEKLSQDTSIAVGGAGVESAALTNAQKNGWIAVVARSQIEPEGMSSLGHLCSPQPCAMALRENPKPKGFARRHPAQNP